MNFEDIYKQIFELQEICGNQTALTNLANEIANLETLLFIIGNVTKMMSLGG